MEIKRVEELVHQRGLAKARKAYAAADEMQAQRKAVFVVALMIVGFVVFDVRPRQHILLHVANLRALAERHELEDRAAGQRQTEARLLRVKTSLAEAVAELGGLDGEVAALLQDLRNAAPNESSSAAKARASQLDEAAALASALSEARQEETLADLRAQTGR